MEGGIEYRHTEDAMVKADSNYYWSLATGILFLGMVAMWSFLPGPPPELQHLLIAVGLLNVFVHFTQAWRLRSLQFRREMAGAGVLGMQPLAAAQPAPNLAALPVPCTIQLRPKWTVICMIALASWLLPIGFFYLFWPHTFSQNFYFTVEDTNTTYVFPLILLVGCLCVPIAALVGGSFLWSSYTRIEVYGDGLRVIQAGRDTFIRWNEARLFAIFSPTLLTRRAGLPIYYELSSRYGIARLPRVYRKMTFSQFFLPAMSPRVPFDDYDRQMDALLSMIAAKTGLPLYDLR
jgi:hypothetical protein